MHVSPWRMKHGRCLPCWLAARENGHDTGHVVRRLPGNAALSSAAAMINGYLLVLNVYL